MRGVRQGLLPEPHSGCAQDPPHGRIAPQVSGVQPLVQPALESQDPSTHPHRSQTVRVQLLRQGVPQELRPEAARSYTCRGRRARRWFHTQG